MNRVLDTLFDIYANEMEIASACYEMMGRLLDKKYVKERVEIAQLSDVYIYGGGYLGIQLYNSISQFTNVIDVVDRKGKLILDICDIPVISLEKFKCVYEGQMVVITPVKFYKSIYEELAKFIPEKKIIYLSELLGGIL